MCTDHQWINSAIRKIEADYQRSADTHLIKLDLPCVSGVDIYLKDESTHPTGSLKTPPRPVHCFYMDCVMAGLGQKLPLLNPHLAAQRFLRLTLPAYLAYRLLR